MGYRSTIYVKIRVKDRQEFEALLKEHDLDDAFELQEFDCDVPYIRYIGDDLKWYTRFDEVKAVTEFIEEYLDDGFRGLIAVGEDNFTEEFGEPGELDMCPVVSVEW